LNYTVEQKDGSINIEKAKVINEQFEISKQFWYHLIRNKEIQNPQDFIQPLPHIIFVQGQDNVNFLKQRYEALSARSIFEGMKYSEDMDELSDWMPLMMAGRTSEESVAASKIDAGTDVNFGELTRKLVTNIDGHDNAEVHYRHEVVDFRKLGNGK